MSTSIRRGPEQSLWFPAWCNSYRRICKGAFVSTDPLSYLSHVCQFESRSSCQSCTRVSSSSSKPVGGIKSHSFCILVIAGGGVIAVIVVVGREDGTVSVGQLSVEAFEHTLRGTLNEVLVSAPAGRSERGESLPDVAVAGPPSVVPSAFTGGACRWIWRVPMIMKLGSR